MSASGMPPSRTPGGRSTGDGRAALGRRGEQLAAAHLERLGFAILARNERTCAGEIDLIAFDGRTLAFVEVKTRCSPRRSGRAPIVAESPLTGLRAGQCARVRRAAVAWLGQRRGQRPSAQTLRFDAIGVLLERGGELLRLEHLEDAF